MMSVVPPWPGWPPGFLTLSFGVFFAGGFPPGLLLSVEGGLELLLLFLESLASSLAIFASCSSTFLASVSTFSQSMGMRSAAFSGSSRHIATSDSREGF